MERVIGTIRRECLDHVLVFGSDSLHRHLRAFIAYYHQIPTHLALTKDVPLLQPVRSPMTVASSLFPRLAACIIATNAARPDPPNRVVCSYVRRREPARVLSRVIDCYR